MIRRQAFSYDAPPASASYSQPAMSSPAGQALLHGGRNSTHHGRSVRHAAGLLGRLAPAPPPPAATPPGRYAPPGRAGVAPGGVNPGANRTAGAPRAGLVGPARP